ncbi:C-type mannose receptor 2-like [Sardina pilchardus]|uniref:C-type mannose receptor 2-like n=1 Tax=Sardina pilchardus TaxID=27697 RepID=UPI002E0D7464
MRKWIYYLPLVLVLFSLALASRQYYYVADPKTWTEAQTYCRENYADLATIRDKDEMQSLNKLSSSHNINSGRAWIGLHNQHENCGDVGMWPENCSSLCVVWYSGSWWGVPCQKTFPFFCSTGPQSPSHSFVLIEKKTWMDAQSHCQVATAEGLNAEGLLVNRTDKAIWVNLQGRNWTWSDGDEPSFTNWHRNWPKASVTCAAVFQNPGGQGEWEPQDCTERSPFFCYMTPKMQMVKVEIRVDSSRVDPSDEEFQTVFLNQIKEKLQKMGLPADATLRWSEEPDGQIFHKKN